MRRTGNWRRQAAPEATLTAMSRARKLLQHLGSPPRMPTAWSAQSPSTSHWVCGPAVASWLARWTGRGFMAFWRAWDPGEDFEEEFFVELFAFLLAGGGQKIVGHVHEQAQVAGGMFAEGLEQAGAQKLGVAGGFEQMIEAGEQLLGWKGFGAQAAADAAGHGQEVRTVQLGGQAAVAGENDGQDGAGVQVGAGEQAQFAETGGLISWASSTRRTGR